MTKKIIYIVGLSLLIAGLEACSDNSTGVEKPPKPEIPNISEMEPKTGKFDNNYPAGAAYASSVTYENFNSAGELVNTANAVLSIKQLFNSFVASAKAGDPVFEDGKWVWEVSHSAQGISVNIRFAGQVDEEAGEVNWTMNISSSGQGVNFDNYKLMEGVTAIDGSTGNWKIYPFEPESSSATAIITFDWSVNGDSDQVITFNVTQSDSPDYTIKYTEDSTTRELTIKSSDGQVDVLIHWDADTGAGYIMDSGTKKCWNQNFEDVSCS